MRMQKCNEEFGMKRFLICLIYAFLSISILASPFGLKMGMSINEIRDACNGVKPKYIEKDCYYVFPIKKHPLFKHYIAFVDPEKGLYCLKIISNDISTNNYGTELQNAFSEIKDRVSKTYGNPRIIDELDPKSIWNDDAYWLKALNDGARKYAAIWDSNKLADDLDCVSIYASAQSYNNKGWIILEYDFLNIKSVQDSQDDVF